MKRVCVLYNHDLSYQGRVIRQVESLMSAGYAVTVYCVAEETLPLKEERDVRLDIRFVFRKRLYKYHAFSLRLLKYFCRMIVTQPRADAVHVIDSPMLPLGWMLSRAWRAPLIYDASEFWEALYDEERDNLLRKTDIHEAERRRKLTQLARARAFEAWVLPKCAAVISVCDSIGNLLRQKARGPFPPYVTLRNLPRRQPPQEETAGKTNRLREQYHIPDRTPILLYQGQVAEKRGLSRALDAIERLDNVVFVIIGPVLPRDEAFFQSMQARIRLSDGLRDKVIYHGFLPQDELPQWTAQADLGVHPILNHHLNHYYCLPNKLFEYLQGGLPVAVSNFPEMRRVVNDYGVGLTFDPEQPTAMAAGIREYLDSPVLQERYRKNVQSAATILNWEQEESRLLTLYRQLFKESG